MDERALLLEIRDRLVRNEAALETLMFFMAIALDENELGVDLEIYEGMQSWRARHYEYLLEVVADSPFGEDALLIHQHEFLYRVRASTSTVMTYLAQVLEKTRGESEDHWRKLMIADYERRLANRESQTSESG